MENHQGTVTGRRNGSTPACPAFAEAASRRQAKRLFRLTYTPNNPLVDRSFSEAKHSGVQARKREDPESFTVSRYHLPSVSF
jgi:hypothetical protein